MDIKVLGSFPARVTARQRQTAIKFGEMDRGIGPAFDLTHIIKVMGKVKVN